MKHLLKTATLTLAACAFSQSAFAGDTSDCELLIVQIIEHQNGEGQAQIPSYIPAEEFLTSLDDDAPGHLTEYAGHKIQAVMCRRNDVIPAHEDYIILSTGIPFILSQDFDSSDTDSLTMYWKDDAIQHVYKGYPLSEEAEAILETRLAGFSKRGLNKWAKKSAERIKAQKQAKLAKEQRGEAEAENLVTVETGTDELVDEIDAHAKPEDVGREMTEELDTETQSEIEILE